ncbi:HEAT repeat domain-containing protein [Streptomyces sp. NPDC059611]|uniref:HEAT repeat domain-containing protein n=1 Tax=Streptomyces sp. NPDC059611 TaxID=3346884 RepID=UPI0036BDD9F4
MSAYEGDDTNAALALADFLRTRAQEAGLSAREIARAFQQRADREQARIAAGAARPTAPVGEMSFSKSHLDRLFKGGATLPSVRFLEVFLEITSAAVGLPPQSHQALRQEATELLTKARRIRARRSARPQSPPRPELPTTSPAIATLQAQLDLERAHRTGDRLRHELSEAQTLMATLLQIIDALRNIITELDLDLFRPPRSAERAAPQSLTERQRTEAATYKAAAEAEYGRVDHRRRVLELLWDQAQGNLRRLTVNADGEHLGPLPDLPPLPTQSSLSPSLHAEPALADIATALGRVQEYNDAEEQKIGELRRAVADNAPLAPDDELVILVAATRLSDPIARDAAVRTVLSSWAHHPRTRDTLLRLVHDDQSAIRNSVAWGLAAAWAGNPKARDAVAALAGDPEHHVRQTAAMGLAHGWAGDHAARDALAQLIQHENPDVKQTVMRALVQGWANDPVVRDCLVALSRDSAIPVRAVAAEFLAEGWTGEGVVHAALSSLCDDPAESIRWIAMQGLTRQGHTPATSPVPDNAILQAVELSSSYQELGTLPVAAVLRQGIDFHEGITVLAGANGTGKTVLLNALALSMDSKHSTRSIAQPSPWSKDLAKHLRITWNGRRKPYSCHYLSDRTVPVLDRYASGLKNWQAYLRSLSKSDGAPNRIVLIDDTFGFLDSMAEREIFDTLLELANQGFQLIVTSSRISWTAFSVARVIKIDQGIHRTVAFDPTKLPTGSPLSI